MEEDNEENKDSVISWEPLLKIKFESVTRDMIYLEYNKLLNTNPWTADIETKLSRGILGC